MVIEPEKSNICLQTGLERLNNLKVLYASNNKITSWADLANLPQLAELRELLLAGNPLYNDYKDRGELAQYRIEVTQEPNCMCADYL